MKKLFLVMVCIITLVFSSVFSVNGDSVYGVNKVSGKKYTVSEFAEKYSYRENESNHVRSCIEGQDVVLEIAKLQYDAVSRDILIKLIIEDCGEKELVTARGMIFNSYKKEQGVNSYVALFDEVQGEYEILLFNIYNSYKASDFNSEQKYSEKPHLKIYLQKSDQIYLFELEIPLELFKVELENSKENLCDDALHDIIWFANILKADISIVDTEQTYNISNIIQSNSGYTTTYLDEIIMTWYVVGSAYIYHTIPFIMHYMPNVSTSDSTWKMLFGTCGCYVDTIGGISYLSGISLSQIKLSVAAGQYTSFSSAATNLKMLDANGGNIYSFAGIAASIIGATTSNPVTSGAAALISSLLQLAGSGCTVTNGTDISLVVPDTRAFSVKSPATARIKDNYSNGSGQYFQYQIVANSDDFGYSSATSGWRTGRINVSFRASAGSTVYEDYSDYVDFSYYCTVG